MLKPSSFAVAVVLLLVAGLAAPGVSFAQDKSAGDADAVVVASKDKPKKSKDKPNKNDDKDNDPDDGNAGGGNDNKTTPGDGPQND